MKTKLLLIVGFLIIVCALMVAPVAAVEASAGTAVSGTLAKTVTLGVSSPTGSITLTPGGGPTTLGSITLSASQNCAGTITAVDAMTDSKNAGTAGYMTNWTGTAYPDMITQGPNPATTLAAKMTLLGASNGVYTAGGRIESLHIATTLYTISGAGSNPALGLSFSQLTALTDPVLPAGNSYRIPVSFVISCT